jgi:hypothetical protein
MRIAFVLLLAALTGGCDNGDGAGDPSTDLADNGDGSSPAGDGGAGDGGGGDLAGGGAPITVHVTVRDTFVSDGTDLTRPTDLADTPLAVLVPASGGGFAVFDPTATAPGSVTFEGVPAQRFYLKFGTDYLLEDPGDITLDRTVLGRADAVANAADQAASVFTLDGMSPWQLGLDRLQLFSVNANAFDGYLEQQIGGPVNAAQTLLDGATETLPHLVDAAKGDSVYITQLVGKTLGDGTPYIVATKSYKASFTQDAMAASNISGSFTAVPQTESLTVSWARSQIHARLLAANAGVQSCNDYFDVAAQPGLAAHGFFSNQPDVLLLSPAPGSSDLALDAVPFGNPYPAGWGLTASVYTYCQVDAASAPGALKPRIAASYFLMDALAKVTAGGTAPRVAAATAPTIAGKDATAYQAGVGATPTFAWQAPSGNAPTGYELELYRIVEVNNKATTRFVARLATEKTGATALRVPSSLLNFGTRYVATLTTIRREDQSASSRISAVLGTFTP